MQLSSLAKELNVSLDKLLALCCKEGLSADIADRALRSDEVDLVKALVKRTPTVRFKPVQPQGGLLSARIIRERQ